MLWFYAKFTAHAVDYWSRIHHFFNSPWLQISEKCSDSMYKWWNMNDINTRHALIQFKVLHRLHFSNLQGYSQAWVLSVTNANRPQQLSTIWSFFFHTVSQAYGYNIQPFPLAAILGIIPESEDCKFLQKVADQSNLNGRIQLLQRTAFGSGIRCRTWNSDAHWSGSLQTFDRTWDPFIN